MKIVKKDDIDTVPELIFIKTSQKINRLKIKERWKLAEIETIKKIATFDHQKSEKKTTAINIYGFSLKLKNQKHLFEFYSVSDDEINLLLKTLFKLNEEFLNYSEKVKFENLSFEKSSKNKITIFTVSKTY